MSSCTHCKSSEHTSIYCPVPREIAFMGSRASSKIPLILTPTNTPIDTACSKCGQPFLVTDTIQGHETATWHQTCPAPIDTPDCYCVCHSETSSAPGCKHCKPAPIDTPDDIRLMKKLDDHTPDKCVYRLVEDCPTCSPLTPIDTLDSGLRNEVAKIVIDEIAAEQHTVPFHDLDVYDEIGVSAANRILALISQEVQKAVSGVWNFLLFDESYITAVRDGTKTLYQPNELNIERTRTKQGYKHVKITLSLEMENLLAASAKHTTNKELEEV